MPCLLVWCVFLLFWFDFGGIVLFLGCFFFLPSVKALSGQQDPPRKFIFLSYSKITDLAPKILPPTIMTPQQTIMVCPEHYFRQGEKTREAKNFFSFQGDRVCTGKQSD